jgi:CBS domain-containing protein
MELRKYLEEERLGQAGYREPVCASPSLPIRQAIRAMQDAKVGCLLVSESGKLRGIFTERDVLQRVLSKGRSLDDPVETVMTPDPVVAAENESLADVLGRMYWTGCRHLPVVGAPGEPLGTISVKRVALFIADHFGKAVYNLPPEHGRYAAEKEGA